MMCNAQIPNLHQSMAAFVKDHTDMKAEVVCMCMCVCVYVTPQ